MIEDDPATAMKQRPADAAGAERLPLRPFPDRMAPTHPFPGADAGVPESCTSFSLSVPTSGESTVEVSVR